MGEPGKESEGGLEKKNADPDEEEEEESVEDAPVRGLSDGEEPPRASPTPKAPRLQDGEPPAGMLSEAQRDRLADLVLEQNNLSAAFVTLSLQAKDVLDELANVTAARQRLAVKLTKDVGLDPNAPWSVNHITGEIRPVRR